MNSKLSAAVVGLAALTVAGFSIGPTMRIAQNPPVIAGRPIEAHLAVPSDVEKILSRSCKDCHSYETRWPWCRVFSPTMSNMLAPT
jgi:hypothetical protein